MATIQFEIPDDEMEVYRELVRGSLHVGFGHINYPWECAGPDDVDLTVKCPYEFTREIVLGLVEGYQWQIASREQREHLEKHGVAPTFKTIADAAQQEKPSTFDFNTNLERRAEILGISPKARFRPRCPIHFDPLHVSRLKTLVEERFIDLDETPPMNTPSNGEFFKLVSQHPNIHVSGHAYNPDACYTGIHLTGICIPGEMNFTNEDKTAFIHFSVTADELEIGRKIRAWWD